MINCHHTFLPSIQELLPVGKVVKMTCLLIRCWILTSCMRLVHAILNKWVSISLRWSHAHQNHEIPITNISETMKIWEKTVGFFTMKSKCTKKSCSQDTKRCLLSEIQNAVLYNVHANFSDMSISNFMIFVGAANVRLIAWILVFAVSIISDYFSHRESNC